MMIKKAVFTFTLLMVLSSANARTIEVNGFTEAIHDVLLGAEDAGVIRKIDIEVGSRVKKGQVLFSLAHRLEQLEVDRRAVTMKSHAELESAQAKVNTLNAIFKSNKALYMETKSISKEELDTLALELLTAKADLKRMKANKDREKIEYQIARELLERKIIKSPINGIVTEVLSDPGESYEPPAPVLRLVSTDPCLFVCNVEETAAAFLSQGDMVSLKINSGSGTKTRSGEVMFISPVADPGSGLLQVRIKFQNKKEPLRPGIAGTLMIEPHVKESVKKEPELVSGDLHAVKTIPPKEGNPELTGIVTATTLMVRETAQKDGKLLGKLPKGTQVTIRQATLPWYCIEFKGNKAFASGQYIALGPGLENTSLNKTSEANSPR
ncbi:efflux RND transporter periplasmic adaptor subunit [uncultured Desulfobacter sp.]|uniref:efflux RND transporter periplasmic adaptor subunit n=1 Tax=uncultured Desulfobacter sp. TaxID=240139 RepID=UPI002AA8DE18|nr:efflux RND transporter periplasmic adaptor subunit [uncultured Desulfobacter sp.]